MTEPTAKQRKMFAAAGVAMPDGSYYIRPDHPEDLNNAISSVGRASGSGGVTDEEQRNAVRCHIMKRAKSLKRTGEIPATWNPDGSLMHFGVKGMHWGVRKSRSAQASDREARIRSQASPDSTKAHDAEVKAKTSGVHSLSNEEIQHLVTRMNLEQQLGKLSATPAGKSKMKKGRDFVDEQTKTGQTVIRAAKTAKELAKIFGPIIIAAAAGAAAGKASGSSGPIRMPQLAITSG